MKRAPSALPSGHEPEQSRERCVYCFSRILSQILGVSSVRLQGQPIKEVLLLAEQQCLFFFLPVFLSLKINNRKGKSRQQVAKNTMGTAVAGL